MFATRPTIRQTGDWICRSCRSSQRRQRLTTRQREYSSAVSPNRRDSQKLPDSPARTRFAPSPTGYLHLGSLRTALFNYLLAKATKGQFLLRIEDTDTKRTIAGAEDRICSDLAWAGLQWDEGPQVGGPHGPYRQSERTELYQEHADRLLESGHAYRCFCTSERLNNLAKERAKIGLPTDYDRTCASIAKDESDERAHKGETFTVRLKAPSLYPEYQDLVYGRVGKKQKPGSTRKHGETVYEDPILLKSDGLPTYHLANVVDDHLMKITHVVRAAEWMPSTPKHLALYDAFGWTPPAFAHVGLLQDGQGQKLSKRNADIDLESYRQRGYFPEALLNFSSLLGWSHTRGVDFMRLQDLIDNFSMKFSKGNTLVTFKKLDFLQKQHGRKYIEERGVMYERILDDVEKLLGSRRETDENWTLVTAAKARDLIASVLAVDAQKSGFQSADKFLEQHQGFFKRKIDRSEPPVVSAIEVEELHGQLQALHEDKWISETIHSTIDTISKESVVKDTNTTTEGSNDDKGAAQDEVELIERKRTELHKYLRWALFSQAGPPIAIAMTILGREISLSRLSEARKTQHGG